MARGHEFKGIPGHPGPYDKPTRRRGKDKLNKDKLGIKKSTGNIGQNPSWWNDEQSKPTI